jgi:predicted nucleotidyltransferase
MNMGDLDGIDARLRELKPELERRFGVRRIGVFGSVARGEEDADSDVDVLVELAEPIGWELLDLQDRLEEVLGRRVDLVTIGALREEMSASVMREVVFA